MQQESQQTTEISLLVCRVLDVQQALQKAYSQFSQQDDNSLDALTLLIQEHLGNVPAFIMETSTTEE